MSDPHQAQRALPVGPHMAAFIVLREYADEHHHTEHPEGSDDCAICEALDATEPGGC